MACRGLVFQSPTSASFFFFFFFSYVLVLLNSFHGVNGYENFTVGDSLGWYDDLEEPKVNYQKWAAGKHFSLGDFLIFNTDKNHSVVQTYNSTTYKRCNYVEAEEDDTTDWTAGEPSYNKESVSIPVPLLKEGTNYFFSGLYEGEQCRHGQKFTINVTHGQGLPDSLKGDDSSSQAPTVSPDGGGSVPDTVVPSNFDHPNDPGDDVVKPTSDAVAGGLCRTLSIGLVFIVGILG